MNTNLFQAALQDLTKPQPHILGYGDGVSLKDEWLWQMAKYIDPQANLLQQVPVFTQSGLYSVDWVLQNEKQRIGFMLSATENQQITAQRAQAIAQESDFDAVYVLRAQDVYYHTDDLLYLFSRVHPRLFSERGRNNLHILATPEVQELTFGIDKTWNIRYEINDDFDAERSLWTIAAHEAVINRFVAPAKTKFRVLKGGKKDTKAA
jgi:hypothetical protein